MKKMSILLFTLLAVTSANYYSFSQHQTKKATTKSAHTTSSKSSSAKSNISKEDIEQGKELLSKSDCLACHQVKTKVVGPAYSAVAEKYAATAVNIDKLSEKVIKGGSGVWGTVPMTPHPAIAAADAKKMVAYILSLKGK